MRLWQLRDDFHGRLGRRVRAQIRRGAFWRDRRVDWPQRAVLVNGAVVVIVVAVHVTARDRAHWLEDR